ncbi:MAG: YggT family protein [Actinobacteria bacterium]|nr:YggT family protein [Actinomycetota bacterium]NBO34756.1 YggT family protein [Actinomycetota bacterium]
MTSVATVISSLLNLYVLILIARLVLEYVAMFARDWRPRGPLLLLSETVYTLTDPPLKAIRRVVPSLRIGSVSLDLSFIILLFAISITRGILASI